MSWITMTQHRRYPFSDSTTFLFGINPSLSGLFPVPQHSFNSNGGLEMADTNIWPQGHEHPLDLYSESIQPWIPHHFTTRVLITVTRDFIRWGHDTIHMQPGFFALATQTPLCQWPYPMAASALFCNLLLSTSFNPGSEKSCILLDWVLASGIPVSRSTAGGILSLPYGNTICSMHMSLSVSSSLAYDLVLSWDWLFFCQETVPSTSFQLTSGVIHTGSVSSIISLCTSSLS
jgi:hypothetical protein